MYVGIYVLYVVLSLSWYLNHIQSTVYLFFDVKNDTLHPLQFALELETNSVGVLPRLDNCANWWKTLFLF